MGFSTAGWEDELTGGEVESSKNQMSLIIVSALRAQETTKPFGCSLFGAFYLVLKVKEPLWSY